MTILDVTNNTFIDANIEEANKWLSDNIGELIHDDSERAYGDGWNLYWMPQDDGVLYGSWILEIEDERKASLFLLRWS